MRTAAAILAALVLVSAGCDKDKPKPEESKPAEPTPVPSDLVFNEFVPANGGEKGLHARGDGGLEGGLASVQGGTPSDNPDDQTAGASDKLKVTDPGADPKAVRKYSFTVGKTEKRIITITQSMTTQAGPNTSPAQELTLKLYVDLTPKAVKKEGATIEAKLTKVDIPNIPASAAPMLASLNGLTGQFDVSPQGEAGEVQLVGSAAMRNQLADQVLQGLSQAVQLLVAPLPEAPIGAGAKWELPSSRPGDPDQGEKTFSAKDLTAEGGTVEASIQMKVPRHQQRTQQGMVFVTVDGGGKYTYQVKWNGFAPHVEGDIAINEKLEAPTNPGEPKQEVTRLQRAKHLVETPGSQR